MDQPEPPVRKPTAGRGAVVGSLVGLLIGSGIAFALAARSGEYDEGSAFRLSACTSGLIALLGFDIAVWRRKPHGGATRKEEWDRFVKSPALGLVLIIVILGSLGLASVSGQLFDAVYRSAP